MVVIRVAGHLTQVTINTGYTVLRDLHTHRLRQFRVENLNKMNSSIIFKEMVLNTVEPLYTEWTPLGPANLSFSGVSSVEGSFNIIKYQNGTREVSLVMRCPL